jgi:hypothetical protein
MPFEKWEILESGMDVFHAFVRVNAVWEVPAAQDDVAARVFVSIESLAVGCAQTFLRMKLQMSSSLANPRAHNVVRLTFQFFFFHFSLSSEGSRSPVQCAFVCECLKGAFSLKRLFFFFFFFFDWSYTAL